MIFEKIRERLQNKKKGRLNLFCDGIDCAIDIINQVEVEYKDVLSNMYYHSNFERRINEVIPMLKTLHLLGTISLIKDLKAENDILRSYLPQLPKGE